MAGQEVWTLERVGAENFLSLRRVEVDLGRLNVFIGKNASGKSNLVKLLRFASLLAVEGYTPKAAKGVGYENVGDIAYGRDPHARVSIALEAALDRQEYRYTVTFKEDGVIESEELQAGGRVLFKREGSQLEYLREDGSLARASIELGRAALHALRHSRNASPAAAGFAGFLGSWAFYNFNPAAIRGSSPVGASERLDYDGGNLPQVLLTLLTTRRREFVRVEELLRAAVPEVEELLTPIRNDRVWIAVREEGFERPFGPEHLSDGTLRLLAFITALALPSPLVSFEEPENCVHPELLGSLVELMRLSGRQVIVTTHSPSLLDHVRPEEVYLVAKVEGGTRVKRLSTVEDIDAVRRFLELGGSLGEAWLSGLLESGY